MEELIDYNWSKILNKEFKKEYFLNLKEFLDDRYINQPQLIFPIKDKIFHALNACPFDKVKVVILGQDPYPTKGHANGLSFSVNSKVFPFPKSLNNIFKELQNDLACPFPKTKGTFAFRSPLSHTVRHQKFLFLQKTNPSQDIPDFHF